jgi:ParB-like chromosome segregation protein Spo0J
LDVQRTRTSAVLVDPSLQPRVAGLDPHHVKALEECPESWPPLAVVRHCGRYLLVDGFHRLAAAQNLGLDTVPVDVVPFPEDGDVHAVAFALNAAHGMPLSLADRRAFAARLLREHVEWADREVGRRAGLSSNTVGKVRENLIAAEEIVEPAYRVGAGGYIFDPTAHRPEPHSTDEVVTVATACGAFTAADRRGQRAVAGWLRDLADAYREGERLDWWQSPEDAAQAARFVFGGATAARLGEALALGSATVAAVAEAIASVPADGRS